MTGRSAVDDTSVGAGPPLLVCLVPVRNAAADVPGFLACVETFCDAIVALDDGSTDGSAAILAAHPLVRNVLTNPPRDDYRAWNDAANRNRLLAAALELDPEWIISLDADERLDERDAASLRRFLETDALPGCAYGFRHVPMREDARHFLPRYDWAYRLFGAAPGQRFRDQKLHFAPVPTDIPVQRYVKTTLRIQHLGELTAAHRLRRFAKYLEADPAQRYGLDYATILRTAPGMQARPWEPRPPGMPVLIAEAQAQSGLDPGAAREAGDAVALSVIVIAQDDEATIAGSIAAIIDQDCPEPFEVILVASGRDRTAGIVREGFPTVTVIELPKPALPGEARNAGLKAASGTYVTFPGSHVTIAPGSLRSRLRAHRRGYAMVTGVTENGTPTPAGWASYFLDHADGLPGQAPAELNGPPAHCSYARLPLLEVGGFPEGVRTAEDTAVNRALAQRGYVALRDPRIRFVHHSPCRTWRRLVTHHFGRGRGWGRLLVERHQETGRLLTRDVIAARLVRHIPDRLARVANGVAGATPELRAEYERVRAGVALGAVASWAGMWWEILGPAPGKWAILAGRPRLTILLAPTGHAPVLCLVDIDQAAGRVDTLALPAGLPLPHRPDVDDLPGTRPATRLVDALRRLETVRGLEIVAGDQDSLNALAPLPGGSNRAARAGWREAVAAVVSIWFDCRSGRIASTLNAWQLLAVAWAIRRPRRTA